MVVATESASLAMNVQLPGREFVEGSVIDVVVAASPAEVSPWPVVRWR